MAVLSATAQLAVVDGQPLPKRGAPRSRSPQWCSYQTWWRIPRRPAGRIRAAGRADPVSLFASGAFRRRAAPPLVPDRPVGPAWLALKRCE